MNFLQKQTSSKYKEKNLAHKKIEYLQPTKRKLRIELPHTKVWQEKKVVTLEYSVMYSPQNDNTLITSKKERKKWWNRQLT